MMWKTRSKHLPMRSMPTKNHEKRGQNLRKIKSSLKAATIAILLQATRTLALAGRQVLGAVSAMEKKWFQSPLNKVSSNAC